MRKLLKIVTWLAATLIALILIAGVITQSSFFRDWLKDFALSELNNNLDAELSIEQIEGNLYSNLELQDVLFTSGFDTIAAVPMINLSYDILALLDNEIIVHELNIHDPKINLLQDSKGTWNISKVMSPDSTDFEVDTLVSDDEGPFPFTIVIESFGIMNANAKIGSNEKMLPETITDLNINIGGIYSADMLQINLDSLSFYTEKPDLVLNKLSLDFTQNKNELLVQNLHLSTGRNYIESQAKYHPYEKNHVKIASKNLDLREFEFMLPDIKLKMNPDISFVSNFTKDSLEFEINIADGEEKLSVIGASENYTSLFDSINNSRMTFNLDLIINSISIHEWLDEDIPESQISGQIELIGSFSELADLEAKIAGEFHDLKFQNYDAEFLEINADYRAGDVEGDIQLFSKSADIDLRLDIEKLMTEPVYQGSIFVTHLDLEKLLNKDDLESDINFNLHFEGEKIKPPENRIAFNIALSESYFNDLAIDTLYSTIYMTGTEYRIETFQLKSPAGLLDLSGTGDIKTDNKIKYGFDIGDLQKLKYVSGADSISLDGRITGLVTGNPDSLKNSTEFDLRNIRYDDLAIDSLAGILSFNKLDSALTVSTELISQNINIGAYSIDTISISSDYDMNQILSEIEVKIDSDLMTSFTAILIPDSIISLSMPRLEWNVVGESWKGALDKLTFDKVTREIDIQKLLLNCITCENERIISVAGQLSPAGTEDFHIDIAGLDLRTILAYLGDESNVGGRFNLNLDLTGTADKPRINGEFLIYDGYVGAIQVQEINQLFDYKDDRFNIDFLLNFNGDDSLTAKGYLPLHLSLTDSLDMIDSESPVQLNVKSESIPIALFLNRLTKTEEAVGKFLCDFSLENNLSEPRFNGNIQIIDGEIRSPYWGIDYQNIELNISALDDKFSLEKFQIIRDDGNIKASGEIQLDLKKNEDNIIYSNMKLMAEDFYLVKHKDFEIQISADIKYQMENKEPKIRGYFDVNRSTFYLPTILERIGYVSERSPELKPALIKAREAQMELENPQQEPEVEKSKTDTLQPPGFLEKLEGDLVIRFPRNTWVRNPQLRLELGGDINLLMENGEFRLKGPLKIVRGQYDLFGRRFTVIEGNIDFQGDREINPPILLEAEYVYRTTGREKKSLILKVTGSVKYPIISFTESNNEISQEDAISIILYGRKKDELSYGTQSDISGSGDQSMIAMGFVSNIVSDRLARSVGDDLSLDVIEVNAQDNWQSANFVVGKYITDDLFLTYKREFGQSTDNNLYPETVTLEYEIVKNIFFQMIQGDPRYSGYDLLFKLNWE